MKKFVFFILVIFLLLITVIYVEKFAISDADLKKELENLSDQELKNILNVSETQNHALVGEATRRDSYRTINGIRFSLNRVKSVTEVVYQERLNLKKYEIENLKQTVNQTVNINEGINCNFKTASELLKTCPTETEIKMIRKDFNIVFDKEPVEWSCTEGGKESSVMLSMYNTFRLMKCTPFDKNFLWAPKYNNMYSWMKSLELTQIEYFMCKPGDECSNAASKDIIYLEMNNLDDPIYREIINTNSGGGAGHLPVLMIHESRHTINGGYKGHTCSPNDQTLQELGAWGVQYHLLNMLADNTGNYFSSYERKEFQSSAKYILETRFCS